MNDNFVLIGVGIALFPIGMILLNWLLFYLGRWFWHRILLTYSSRYSKIWTYYLKEMKMGSDRILYTETGAVIFFFVVMLVTIFFA